MNDYLLKLIQQTNHSVEQIEAHFDVLGIQRKFKVPEENFDYADAAERIRLKENKIEDYFNNISWNHQTIDLNIYKLLNAHYSVYDTINVDRLSRSDARYVATYLINTAKDHLLQWNMSQATDVEKLLNGEEIPVDFNMEHWDMREVDYITLMEKRGHDLNEHLFRTIVENVYDENLNTFLIAITGRGDTTVYRRLINDVPKEDSWQVYSSLSMFFNSHNASRECLNNIKSIYITKDQYVAYLMHICDNSYSSFNIADYINIESVIRYVKNANMHIKNKQITDENREWYGSTELNANINKFRAYMTSINTDVIQYEYETSALFNMPPLMYSFRVVKERYKNTGELDLMHLRDCEAAPFEREFGEFLLEMDPEKLEQFVRYYARYDEGTRRAFYGFSHQQKIDLINKCMTVAAIFHD